VTHTTTDALSYPMALQMIYDPTVTMLEDAFNDLSPWDRMVYQYEQVATIAPGYPPVMSRRQYSAVESSKSLRLNRSEAEFLS
jgi:hypothetical protein